MVETEEKSLSTVSILCTPVIIPRPSPAEKREKHLCYYDITQSPKKSIKKVITGKAISFRMVTENMIGTSLG